ncbi:hypothetical protein GCM10025863_10320 [Microbacterium suwonense]|uniref:M23ase beta-sheet core domain-containing protein n=2 Tax=Microbacterium suwonense TaxID=683047 RepID=A0ABM8FRV7_9MICO|nr:hypothetical protein GCM10025863_10320 [Microbacterium suwonense]
MQIGGRNRGARREHETSHAIASRRRPRLVTALCLLAIAPGLSGASAAATTPPRYDAAIIDRSADDVPGYPWRWPVHGRHDVVAPFRASAHDYAAGHRGMDIAVQSDAEVHSPAAGVVAFRGTVVDRPLITIDHGGGYVTTLEPVVSERDPGDVIAAGDVVGTAAAGGHAVRGTLHVGVRVEGRYVNPRGLFGAVPRAVLLPCCSQ